MPAWTDVRRAASSASSSSPSSPTTRRAGKPSVLRQLSADVRRHRRDARAHRRRRAHRVAHRLPPRRSRRAYLAREDASHLVMVGAGALAPHLVARPCARCGRSSAWRSGTARARRAVALGLRAARPPASSSSIVDDLDAAVRDADIVSCATLSASRSSRRVAEARARMSTWSAASRRRCARPMMTRCTRARLCRYPRRRAKGLRRHRQSARSGRSSPLKRHPGRSLRALPRHARRAARRKDEITLFKSVGTAIEDLAAAVLVSEDRIVLYDKRLLGPRRHRTEDLA